MKFSGPAYLWEESVSPGAVRPFDMALQVVRDELASEASLEDSGDIFAAHLEMLSDPLLTDTVQANLDAGMEPLGAVEAARDAICAMFEGIDDEYLRTRADDVRDVFRRITGFMCGTSMERRDIPHGSVVVAEELLPSDTARIDFSRIAGILCRRGSTTSHVCIIARSKGVPVQVGVDVSDISAGEIVEGDDPSVGAASVIAALRGAGRKLYANAGSLEDIEHAIANGADGIGLFRTEFLFMDRREAPSEDEQRLLYLRALGLCGERPLYLRLLDIGGDKSLPYLPMEHEDNPFLGLRGVRFGLAHADVYGAQIRAAACAAQEYPGRLHLMIPMVCSAEEIRAVRDMIPDTARDAVRTGIMVETPAAVFNASELACESAFFSIGTNDLTQYIMAADRGNHAVSYLYDGMSGPVMQAVRLAAGAAREAGIPVGVCGELASDPRATSRLLSCGLDYLSLSRIEAAGKD